MDAELSNWKVPKKGEQMNERINEKIGAWLLEEGNSRLLLAQSVGLSRPALNKRLEGRTKWKWNEVVTVAKLTGCSLNELAGMTD